MRNNKRALYESIMNKVGSVVYRAVNEMDWDDIKDKLDKDKRPYARKLGRLVGDYIQSDAYLKNYPQKKYFPKTREELNRYVKFEIEKQGGVNVDLNMIDTSNVEYMDFMFYECSSLETLDVSQWDTSNVEDMCCMFYDCSSLKTLYVSGWNTSKLKNMEGMFECCSSLKSLDVSRWDTSNVKNMLYMFRNCSSLKTLDVSGWDTSKVKDMSYMFYKCSSLETLDVSDWDTSKVENMEYMFFGCRKLKADISMWEIAYECETEHMLQGTRNIECIWDNAEELMENKKYKRR